MKANLTILILSFIALMIFCFAPIPMLIGVKILGVALLVLFALSYAKLIIAAYTR